ncbi:MAG TPA: cell wall hydrolase [Candidatus Omnitrophota bacterium]|nr:cell wall hydrolase [Candidatus Omnitrophota bacterium]
MVLVETEADRESTQPPPIPGSAIDILARTLWGEARGETVKGKEAIAAVVMNRVRRARERNGAYWWGASVEQVCLKPWQFSCWNATDPNRAKLEAVTMDNRVFRTCVRIARRAVGGVLADPTNGATHYHVRDMSPPWSRGREPSAEIGAHLFYNDVE